MKLVARSSDGVVVSYGDAVGDPTVEQVVQDVTMTPDLWLALMGENSGVRLMGDGSWTVLSAADAAQQASLTVPAFAVGSLAAKAAVALAANRAFLALATPTQRQALAQVQALTRQVDAMIAFLLSERYS